MFVRVWQYRPRAGFELEFERFYGPNGPWAELFKRSAGYLGTELRPAPDAHGEYQTIDRWESRTAWQDFLRAHSSDYELMDQRAAAFTASEAEVSERDEPADPP